MAFKPKAPVRDENAQSTYVPIIPEDGLQAVQVGMILALGDHKKLPKFAKDNANKREQDENGEDKIIWPKEGKDSETKVAVYIDLLDQTHDYEGEIGVKNIRLALHQVSRGMSEGMNLTTVAPRDADGKYIKGRPWTLAPSSQWCKIAAVTKMPDGAKVSDVMLRADYKNPHHNNVELLLGKPFMFNVEVTKTEKGDNTYHNTKLKSPVPLMKGMKPEAAMIEAISISFEDDDLLEEKEELGGVSKLDLIRSADLRKIVLAVDYPGTKMQEAIREKHDEKELILKAKEILAKIIENDKELNEIKAKFPNGPDGGSVAEVDGEKPAEDKPVEKVVVAKPVKPKKPVAPVEASDDDLPY